MENFTEAFARIIELPITETFKTIPLKHLTLWDSIAILSTSALIDECFHFTISGSMLEKCETFGDIERLIVEGMRN